MDFFFKFLKFVFNLFWILLKIFMKLIRKKGTSFFYLRKGIISKVNDLFVRKYVLFLFFCLRLRIILDV